MTATPISAEPLNSPCARGDLVKSSGFVVPEPDLSSGVFFAIGQPFQLIECNLSCCVPANVVAHPRHSISTGCLSSKEPTLSKRDRFLFLCDSTAICFSPLCREKD